MILHELVRCHAVRAALSDPDRPMPPLGWSVESIHLLATLSPRGELMKLEPLGAPDKSGKRSGQAHIVPGVVLRGSNKDAARLWDKSDYALGVKVDKDGKITTCPELWDVFAKANREIFAEEDAPALRAFCAFLNSWTPEKSDALLRDCGVEWKKMGTGRNVAFSLNAGDFLHNLPAAKDVWNRHPQARAYWVVPKDFETSRVSGQCMVTGAEARIPLTHPKIKGVLDADGNDGKGGGRSLISFNKECPAFSSHGWKQNENAQVGEESAFQYTAALSWLLRRENGHRVRFSGTVVVFWSERPDGDENQIALWMGGEIPEGEDDASLREKLGEMRKGKRPQPIEKNANSGFFVLGLAGTAGRIAVRFWHESTVGEMWNNIADHYRGLEIAPTFQTPIPQTPRRLRDALSAPGKEIPDNLSAEFLSAIISGEKYPRPLLALAVRQAVSDRPRKNQPKSKSDLRARDESRAALVRAFLIRNCNQNPMETKPVLNPEHPEPAYHLGRLFAALEKLQGDALGDVNATIRDRFIGGALSRPGSVFPVLIRGAHHHLRVLRGKHPGLRVKRDQLIEEIHNRVRDKMPQTMTLEQQGMFFLGYYHQRQSLWPSPDGKKTDSQKPKSSANPTSAEKEQN